MAAIDWDAGAYDRISDMQLESGREFLAGLSLRGDDAVMAGQSDPSTAHFLHMNLTARLLLRQDGYG